MNMNNNVKMLDSCIRDSKGMQAAELEATQKKIREIDGHVKEERDARERNYAMIHERFHHIEQKANDFTDKHNRHIKESEVISARLREIHNHVKNEGDLSEAQRNAQTQELKLIADKTNEHNNEIEAVKKELQNLNRRFTSEGQAREMHQNTVQDPYGSLETGLGASAVGRVKDATLVESPASASGSAKFALPRFGPADMGRTGDMQYMRELTSLMLRNDGVADPGAFRMPRRQSPPESKMGRGVSLPSLSEVG